SIAGHIEVALHTLTETDPAFRQLAQVRKVLGRCAAATEQLANFSRAEGSHASIVNLNDAIMEMDGVLRSVFGDSIELEIDVAASDASVRMDAAHVEQILLSAARNARQAMPNGGKFRVETASVVLRDREDGRSNDSARYVRWTMSDSGVGMTESTRRRAFEPFFTTKPLGSGTGLGLSLVKAAVERAGGAALLESELDHGTSLVIHLPCASAASRTSS